MVTVLNSKEPLCSSLFSNLAIMIGYLLIVHWSNYYQGGVGYNEAMNLAVRNIKDNPLLKRKQVKVSVRHVGVIGPSRDTLKKLVATKLKHGTPDSVVIMDLRTCFGGGLSTATALVYDDKASMERFTPRYRQVRMGVWDTKKDKPNRKSRRARKKIRIGAKKLRGSAKAIFTGGKKAE